MIIRGARKANAGEIAAILEQYNCTIDTDHLSMMLVAEDDDGKVIGVCSLVTLLEGAFLLNKATPKRQRLTAMKLLIETGSTAAKSLGYDIVHGFVEDKLVERTLRKKFNFIPSVDNVLIKRV